MVLQIQQYTCSISAFVFEGFRVVEDPSLGSAEGNSFTQNMSRVNGGFGYLDASSDGGTAGTGNTYTDNECDDNTLGDSSPAGLCSAD